MTRRLRLNDKIVSLEASAPVFNIQRYSLHDGSGIRTLVFIKGCPLKCRWCSNPEGQKNYPELGYLRVKCVGPKECGGRCVEVCSNQAIESLDKGEITINREKCKLCGECAKACYYGALKIIGQYMSIGEILTEVEEDQSFYRYLEGGVTLGGGEPLINPGFSREFLKECKERGLHTVLETCGFGPWKELRRILEYVDLLYYDIKHMDSEKHREMTGVSNKIILENARKILSMRRLKVVIRIPVVPGFNNANEQVKAIARFVKGSGGEMMELLPYHRLGQAKYRQYGMEFIFEDVEPPSEERMEQLREIVRSCGLEEVTGKI